jgi:UDP-N-acetyl-D-galactosamine dehydrogenase
LDKSNYKISVSGLGYVGLPVLIAFSKLDEVVGFDINSQRIRDLSEGIDKNNEVNKEDLLNSNIKFSNNIQDIKAANFHIVAVPTPVSKNNDPDLSPLISASEKIGTILKKGDIVVYESTVYPGVTEEICIPILEEKSSLKIGVDFKVGYSPERINPGDKEHVISNIVKVVSGSDDDCLEVVATTYGKIVKAGIFKAASIKTAEAAKVIENTQRDINIALVNELSLIFNKLDIDTSDVLEAANTKWNFLDFRPGLVGGHCIGVDPYYLTYKSRLHGYEPQVILSGRKINDHMAHYISDQIVQEIEEIPSNECMVTIMGITFKEDCPDIRNSKVLDIIENLKAAKISIQISDPIVSPEEVQESSGIELTKIENLKPSNILLLAVAHSQFKNLSKSAIKKLIKEGGIIYDLKNIFKKDYFIEDDISHWKL